MVVDMKMLVEDFYVALLQSWLNSLRANLELIVLISKEVKKIIIVILVII